VTYSYCHQNTLFVDIHNPFSIVLITLYGSIQGSNPEFTFVKILVNTTIKESKCIILSWCECNRAINSWLKCSVFMIFIWDKILKLTYSFIWTFLNGSSSGESDIRKTIKINFMLRVRNILSVYTIYLE
jgi:hypothetical protein